VKLLDTHVLIHYVSGDRKLGRRAHAAIDRALAAGEIFVSALSFWEVAMLVAKDRLALDTTVSAFRTAALATGIQEEPVDGEIAIAAGELPEHHSDPADRMLVATALVRGLTLLTADTVLLAWKLRGLRVQDASD
jgi:PIN domain nuclease of toxin-antitoxin system